ncbi:FUSC family protein [Nocardioides sp. cx-173]|uniref:FUSC family protein n=1 Tax=Nocardioides sp. cx-173 TaxID=2898796 RepID=UPI001E3D9E44|nr:hypothetical protein [Nocardioides sp. cx-173]MCD4527117.1 hypothetical protein [Nocardioides sp. cx-173]UGB42480.1 hypothetical protein LQ940_02900 [Nocardioides sp. cx-173]
MSRADEVATSTAHEPTRPKRPGGSPVVILLMVIVLVPAILLADTFDAGPAAIIGGLVALFSLIAFMGGPLRADLRTAALMVPLLLLGAVVPRLLSDVWRPAAIALVVVICFVAALLPRLGSRFDHAGLGLGMTTLYAYAYATHGAADHRQVIAAAVAGVVVALALRLLLGISDPSKPTRDQVADVLVADDAAAATTTAFDTWLSDGRQRWLATALEGASQYRLALCAGEVTASARPEEAAALRSRAADLAKQLRDKHAPGADADPGITRGVSTSPTTGEPLDRAAAALDTVAQAVRERDTSAVALDRGSRHALRDAVLHPSARLRSIQVRHALRTAFGLLVILVLTASLGPGDPLVASVLMTTFMILQASWRDTLGKARAKIIGLVVGSAAVAVILLVVPERYLMAIAAVSLALGLWYITTRPALGNAFMVVVSVGINAATRDLDAGDLLVQYVALTACAVAVGVALGFTVVPAFRPAPLRERVVSATEATEDVLRAAANGSTSSAPAFVALQRDAAQKQDELVPDRDHLDERQLAELDRLRSGLRDLTTLVDTDSLDHPSLSRTATMLQSADGAADGPTDGAARLPATNGASSTLWDLVEQTGAAERYLLRTLPSSA